MKLNSSELYLGLMQDVLNNVIAPELKSESAKTAAAIMQNTFAEMVRRERGSPAILATANQEGMALISVMQEALLASGRQSLPLPPIHTADAPELSFNLLLEANAEITRQLSLLAQALSDIPAANRAPNLSLLLQQAGNWEYQLHIDLLQTQNASNDDIDAHDPLPFDVLEQFIRSVHPDGDQAKLLAMERAEGGSGKQTFFITIADASSQKTDLVVRKADHVQLLTTGAYVIEREFHLLKIVADKIDKVPRPLWFAKQFPGTDGDFFIMERSPGKIPGTFLGGASSIPDAFLEELPIILAALHNIPLDNFNDYIEAFDNPSVLTETIEDCTRRTIEEWQDYAKTAHQLPSPALIYMMDWLGRHVPANKGRPVLVHGDYNAHNILMHENRVSAILDWEGALFGAPEMDLAYIRPHISKHIAWQKFMALYRQAGGAEIDESALDYYQAVLGMRVVHGLCAGTQHLQDRTIDDYRIIMVQLGYVLDFMQRGLGVCKEP
jgi:aminoglycoside phosphotransferase (APT) family kinase protein